MPTAPTVVNVLAAAATVAVVADVTAAWFIGAAHCHSTARALDATASKRRELCGSAILHASSYEFALACV